ITSTLANNATRTLGIAEASAVFPASTFTGTNTATFSGQTGIDNTTVLVKYTRYGDANLSGVTDFGDLGIVLNHFNPLRQLTQRDFNFTGFIDFADLGLLLNNFNSSPPLG